jgi:glutamine amidotransferase
MKIGIVALDSSNFRSIGRAISWIDIEYVFINNRKDLNNLSHLILPGVSSFGSVMNELISRDLIEDIEKLKEKGLPILGLCAGMQIMGDSSEESPGVAGLRWFEYKCEVIKPKPDLGVRSFHTGWNEVYAHGKNSFSSLPGVFYFNHSFYVQKLPGNEIFGKTEHGQMFASVIRKDNVIGAQFHPEKSQSKGLDFLRNFINLAYD